MSDPETLKKAMATARRTAAAYVSCVKLGPYPTHCVIGYYGCDCKNGQYCERLPPPK